jgi:hypothetical protein
MALDSAAASAVRGEGVGSGAASPSTGTLCGAGPALGAGHRQRSARATGSARRGPPAALGADPTRVLGAGHRQRSARSPRASSSKARQAPWWSHERAGEEPDGGWS